MASVPSERKPRKCRCSFLCRRINVPSIAKTSRKRARRAVTGASAWAWSKPNSSSVLKTGGLAVRTSGLGAVGVLAPTGTADDDLILPGISSSGVDGVVSFSAVDETINGLGGNDRIDGGPGADIFVFTGNNGNDRIADFTGGSDRIDFTAYDVSDVSDFNIDQVALNTVISGYDGQGNTVTLENFDKDNLSNEDFILGPPDVITGTENDDEITPAGVSEGVIGGIPSDDDDIINALDGNDIVNGGGGLDTIDGGDGDDEISGDKGKDSCTDTDDDLFDDDVDENECEATELEDSKKKK